jgi:uncharacterized SAM-binding protein YcdF (DUF218 family)
MTRRSHPHCPSRRLQSGGIFLRLVGFIVLAAVLFLVYLLREPILSAIGGIWVTEEAPISADVIVLLGDDNYAAQRATRAAELYHERYAPVILASGRHLRPYITVADLMLRDLTDRGVPASAVLRAASAVANTREEAVLMRSICEKRGWKKVLVVTSNYHSRRTHYIFERVFAGGPEFRVIAARDSDYNPRNWWRSRLAWKRFLYESVGIAVASWETRSSKAAMAIEAEKLNVQLAPAAAR